MKKTIALLLLTLLMANNSVYANIIPKFDLGNLELHLLQYILLLGSKELHSLHTTECFIMSVPNPK